MTTQTEPTPSSSPRDTPPPPDPQVGSDATAPPAPDSAQHGTTTDPREGVPSDALPAAPKSPTAGLVAVGMLIATVMAMGLVVLALRKRLFRAEPAPDASAGFLEELRAALREGRISQEEFDAAKRAMIARLTRAGTPEKNGPRGM